jgi:hypothetical protein
MLVLSPLIYGRKIREQRTERNRGEGNEVKRKKLAAKNVIQEG